MEGRCGKAGGSVRIGAIGNAWERSSIGWDVRHSMDPFLPARRWWHLRSRSSPTVWQPRPPCCPPSPPPPLPVAVQPVNTSTRQPEERVPQQPPLRGQRGGRCRRMLRRRSRHPAAPLLLLAPYLSRRRCCGVPPRLLPRGAGRRRGPRVLRRAGLHPRCRRHYRCQGRSRASSTGPWLALGAPPFSATHSSCPSPTPDSVSGDRGVIRG